MVALVELLVFGKVHHGAKVLAHEVAVILAHEKGHDEIATDNFAEKFVETEFESKEGAKVAHAPYPFVICPQGVGLIQIKSVEFFRINNAPRSLDISSHEVILKLEHVLSEVIEKD